MSCLLLGSCRQPIFRSFGVMSRSFGRWHAIGPYLYIERGGFMIHLYLRYFREPWQYGIHRGCSLRIADRYVHFRRRRP